MRIELVVFALAVLCSCSAPVGVGPNAGGGPAASGGGTSSAGGGSGGGGGALGSADGGPWSLVPAVSPLAVAPVADVARRVKVPLDVDGGTVSTTAADGTTFELTVPGDALYGPLMVVMTPVALSTHPFGDGAAFGVELEPSGTTFYRPLTLVITPPAGSVPPVKQQVPFGWSGVSGEVELAIPAPTDSRLVVRILHFSGYAYATAHQGFDATVEPVRNRIGGSAEARIESAVAEALAAERQAQLDGSAESGLETWAQIEALMDQWNREVVQPRLAAAGESCAASKLALQTLLSFERMNQLMGKAETPGFAAQLEVLLENGSSICLDEEYALCRDDHIIQRLLPVYIGLMRQAELTGFALSPALQAKALKYFDQCWRFDLDFTSRAGDVKTGTSGWTFSEAMQGTVHLHVDPVLPPESIKGTGGLDSTAYAMAYNKSCWAVKGVSQIGTTLAVSELFWDVLADPTKAGKGEIKDFVIRYTPFPNYSSYTEVDNCVTPAVNYPNQPLSWSADYFLVMASDPQYLDAVNNWHFDTWVVHNGSAVLATKDVDATYTDTISHTVTAHLELKHTPGP